MNDSPINDGPDEGFTVGTLRATAGDAQAVIDAARAACEPFPVVPDGIYVFTTPEGARQEVRDLGATIERRPRGTYYPSTVEAFAAYVERFLEDDSTIWVHPTQGQVRAVLNDHGPNAHGWGDHRASLDLLVTDEWKFWAAKDGHLADQASFAEHIEDGVKEIVEPAAAEMLEIAQSIHISSSANVRSATRLSSGEVKMAYDETIEGKAGASGELAIPTEFKLAIAPFVGEDAYEVTARLRYRLRAGSLSIGYRLERPEDVVRDALERVAARLGERFDGKVYVGEPRI